MSIKFQLALIVIAAVLLSVVSAIGYTASHLSERMGEMADRRLSAVHNSKAREVNAFLERNRTQVTTLAETETTKRALIAFAEDFHEQVGQVDCGGISMTRVDQELAAIYQPYEEYFESNFERRKFSRSMQPLQELIPGDSHRRCLQYSFSNGSEKSLPYFNAHDDHHHGLNHFLSSSDYYDIILIDADGDIVYTVLKEHDFATSLTTGPYSKTNIGALHRDLRQQAIDSCATQFGCKPLTRQVDLAPYLPSYNHRKADDEFVSLSSDSSDQVGVASFLGSPIYDAGKYIGMVVFQLSFKSINSILTDNYLSDGYQTSGESFVAALDSNTQKFIARTHLRDPQTAASEEFLRNQTELEKLLNASEKLRRDKAMVDHTMPSVFYKDYRDVITAAFMLPLNTSDNFKWYLITKQDKRELFAFNQSETVELVVAFVLIVALISCIAVGFSNWTFRKLAPLAEKLRAEVPLIEVQGQPFERTMSAMLDSLTRRLSEVRQRVTYCETGRQSGVVEGGASLQVIEQAVESLENRLDFARRTSIAVAKRLKTVDSGWRLLCEDSAGEKSNTSGTNVLLAEVAGQCKRFRDHNDAIATVTCNIRAIQEHIQSLRLTYEARRLEGASETSLSELVVRESNDLKALGASTESSLRLIVCDLERSANNADSLFRRASCHGLRDHQNREIDGEVLEGIRCELVTMRKELDIAFEVIA